MPKLIGTICATLLFAALAMPGAGFAQGSRIYTLSIVDVKSDMIDEYEDLQKQLNVAMREAGVTERYASAVVRGGKTTEYVFLSAVGTFASLDDPPDLVQAMGGAAAWARWVAQVRKCTQDRTLETLRDQGDLSIPLTDGRQPTLVMLRIEKVLPGRRVARMNWLRDQWVPALKRAGADGVFRYENAHVGRILYEVSLHDDWASFEGGHIIRRQLGDEAWAGLFRDMPGGPTADMPDVRIMRVRNDLSILP